MKPIDSRRMKIENENGKGKLIQEGDEREYETNDGVGNAFKKFSIITCW